MPIDTPEDSPQFLHFDTAMSVPKDLEASALFLATKPQMIPGAVQSLKAQIKPETLLVSVAAGVTIDAIKGVLAAPQPVVRAMPNIGAMVGRSASAAFGSPDVTETQIELVNELFSAVGQLTWLQAENDLHVVTAVSGSGPAYFFAMCEAMIKAAQAEGLSEEVAKSLVLDTISASGRLLDETPDPTHLRKIVTSPNGTTAAGLTRLGLDDALNKLTAQAIVAAKKRSQALARL